MEVVLNEKQPELMKNGAPIWAEAGEQEFAELIFLEGRPSWSV